MKELHIYNGDQIDVTWLKSRCVHTGACIRAQPRVFDPGSRPWVMCDNSTADKVADAVQRCPTGALHYTRKDGGPEEQPDATNTLQVSRNGPLYVRGQLELVTADGTITQETRLALCRCGASAHKPLCDNAHLRIRFDDGNGPVPTTQLEAREADADGVLKIEPEHNGPLFLGGRIRVLDAEGRPSGVAMDLVFCRCGNSGTKPFCDGSHDRTGFSSDG